MTGRRSDGAAPIASNPVGPLAEPPAPIAARGRWPQADRVIVVTLAKLLPDDRRPIVPATTSPTPTADAL